MKTKNVFKVLAYYMIGFGILMGTIFPFFVLIAVKVPSSQIFNPLFFFMCISAGFLVGVFNIFLAKKIVGAKMRQLSNHMKYVENRLIDRTNNRDNNNCTDKNCYIPVISRDEIGESARAFNALVKALAKAFESETSIRTFTELLSSHLDLDQLAEDALSQLMETLHACGGTIIIERKGELSLLSSYGIKEPQVLLKSDMVWKVFKDQKRALINLPEEILLDGILLDFRPKSILIEPIVYKGVILGVAILAGVTEFTNDMQDEMKLFGHGLALAFKNAITHDQLQKLAANDPLTGVLNRRFGLSRFNEEFSRAVRTDQPIGIVMIDIDHFKRINDTYGHLIGDRILIKLTQTIKAALREGDVLLRYGSEEFVVVLPGASISDVQQISERMRRLVEDTQLNHNSQSIKITVSIGGTSFPENNVDNIMEMIKTADTKLYQAKSNGRNLAIIE